MDPATSLSEIIEARRDLTRSQLRSLLRFYPAAAVVIFVVGLVTSEPRAIFLSAVNLIAWIGFQLVLRTDRLQITGFLVCFVLLATATYSTWNSGFGILDSTTTLFAVVAVFTVMLLRRTLLVFMFLLTVVAIFVIGFRVKLGLYDPGESDVVIPVDPIVVAMVVAMLAIAVRRQQIHQWRALTTSLMQERALKLQAEQLQASERRWRTLVHAAPEWIMQIDVEAVIRFTNRNDKTSHADDIGRPLVDLVGSNERDAVTRAVGEVLAGRRPAPLEVVLVLDGDKRHCVMNLGPLTGPEGVTGAIILVSDETDRRHLQMQLEQAQRLDSLGRLAGGIAHDFNNLLTVISGHTDLAASSATLPPDLAEDLEAIRIACERASGLTRQILAFGRQQPQQAQPLLMNDSVEQLTPMLRRLLGEDVDLVLDLAAGLPPILGDPSRVEQIVMNLVVNARDAVREAERREPTSATEGHRITVRTRMLSLDVAETSPTEDWIDEPLTDPGVVLEVEDTGTGMDESVRLRAFEPFFSTKPKGEGSGLGLAMVYGIVKQNSGAIRILSAPASGTSVAVALPARPDLVIADGAEAPTDETAVGGSETVLLVEDDDAVRELTRRMLEDFGYRVIECCGLDEALAAVDEHTDVAIVVTDIVMPGGTGLELAEKLPEKLPVLFTSGYASNASREAINRIPEGCFLQKPFTPEDLGAAVRSLLEEN